MCFHYQAIKELSKSRLRRMQYNDLMRFAGPRARASVLTSTTLSSQDNLVLQNKRRKVMEDSTPPIDEVDILKSLDHNNIIRLLDVIDDADSDSVFLGKIYLLSNIKALLCNDWLICAIDQLWSLPNMAL